MGGYTFNPTPAQASLLAQIAQRESGGNYTARISAANCQAMGYTVCTASGAYQFIDATWQQAAAATGVGTEYASAADAPAWMQDVNALWLLRAQGTQPWASSAPPGGYTPVVSGDSLVDVSGADASVPTPDILDQLNTSDVFSQVDPTTGLVVLVGLGVLAFVAMGN